MSENAVRMAAYAEYLEKYRGVRKQHDYGKSGCDKVDHCLVHNVDEPAPTLEGASVYRECGECRHVYVTEEDLQREDLRQRERAWQGEVATDQTIPHVAPEARPGKEIHSCPLCTHDF